MTASFNRMTRLIVFVAVLIALLSTALTPAAAQPDLDTLRRTVQEWLLQELNKPTLILNEYTYLGTSWPDESLGCPVEGETYAPGNVNGYEWTFEFNNQVRYTVHSDVVGKIIVLCSAINVGPEVRLVRYQGAQFSILKPEAWLDFPDGDNVLFGSQSGEDCTRAGMRVTVLGQVASGVTPDDLLTDYLATSGASDSPASRNAVGTFGRVTVYETQCNGLAVQRTVAAFVEYGRAYRVEQWSPVDDLPTWAQPFENMVAQFAGAGTTPPAANGTNGTGGETDRTRPNTSSKLTLPPLPVAFLLADDVFVADLNKLPGRSVTNATRIRRYLTFSPDGLHLGFVATERGDDAPVAAQLRAMNAFDAKSARKLADDLALDFPLAWRPDGQWVAYVVAAESSDPAVRNLEIRGVSAEGSPPEALATFAYAAGCAAPEPDSDPADAAYFREGALSEAPNVLVWLPENHFLISSGCGGGLSYLDPGEERVIELGADMLGGALSPDGTRFAARTPDGIAVLDFTAWQRSNLKLGADAVAVAWAADSSVLYYAAETEIDRVTLDDEALAEAGEELFGTWPVSAGMYDLRLVRVDVANVSETETWRGTGRGIGRIVPAPDGSGVLFTIVPSATDWIEAFRNGYEPFALAMAQPAPALYWLPSGEAVAHLIAYGGQPTFAPFALPADS